MSDKQAGSEQGEGSDLRSQGRSAESRSAESLSAAGGALSEAVTSVLRVLVRRGRVEAERLASRGRVRLDLRQLRRDRDVMYAKLGREARTLVEGGEIDHPGLHRGVDRIREIDVRIEEVEHLAARSAGGEPPSEVGEDAG